VFVQEVGYLESLGYVIDRLDDGTYVMVPFNDPLLTLKDEQERWEQNAGMLFARI
jgi:hypothetical protein